MNPIFMMWIGEQFYLELPNKVGVIETDDFKLDDKSFKLFVNFLNNFKGINIDPDQLSFLR